MSLKLDKEFYITLQGQCLPINWISGSDIVEIEGPGEIFIDGFSFLNEQHLPIHSINPPVPSPTSGRRITRTRRFETILVFEERTTPAITEFRTVSASQGDLGEFINFFYGADPFIEGLSVSGNPFICGVGPGNPNIANFFSLPGIRIILNLNIKNTAPGEGGDWEHELKADLFDIVSLYPFIGLGGEPTPFTIKDSRFLSFNTLTNGVDIEMEQIPGTPTFCNDKLSSVFLTSDPKNKITINESSIEKEIPTPIDLVEKTLYDRGITFNSALPDSCGMAGNYGMDVKEYWLLEPPTSTLLAAMDPDTPNDTLFDDITEIQEMVEATPGQTETIYGILRLSTGFINSFNWNSNSEVFGNAIDGPIVRMSHIHGVDMAQSTNTIQFSKGKKLFAGNGGLNLVGF